ncbi:hypothetical protein FOJ82_08275 [Tessaracoccus rhinocerotis]|uniref:Uncharacterized protein n=1 Tax=Tessaracoccus rhinocerotis TaxID=1689449 RepID=A0A553K028_9ACTN|nr:hypothetical protein [Tessaracoccus rhinocerotis]TRY18048.1 hypothetical protein FOJ82_08275 [Tessaracoccus rhinocerotis]
MSRRRPIEPTAVEGEPQAVRWVVDTGELGVGEVDAAPGTLGPLLQYGVLTRVVLEDGAVVTWLADDHTWTDHGPRIRDAVNVAIDLEGWALAGNGTGPAKH